MDDKLTTGKNDEHNDALEFESRRRRCVSMTILLREHAHFARQFHALSFRAILRREVYLLIFSGDSEVFYSLLRNPFLIYLPKMRRFR